MRLLRIVTLTFIFNTVFMPLLGMAHEQSHQIHEGTSSIFWSDEDADLGLFQMIHDDHHDNSDIQKLNTSNQLDKHQCHHVSVLGMTTFIDTRNFFSSNTFESIEPLFLLQSFPERIDYPPKQS